MKIISEIIRLNKYDKNIEFLKRKMHKMQRKNFKIFKVLIKDFKKNLKKISSIKKS
jgi:hypothetical protein